jgi:hypothetical protein
MGYSLADRHVMRDLSASQCEHELGRLSDVVFGVTSRLNSLASSTLDNFLVPRFSIPQIFVLQIDGSLDARDCAIAYKKGGRTLATVTISRDLQSLQAEAAMEAAIRPQRREVA